MRHADRIHAVCRRIVAHHEDALDATQEAMIAVARGITRFDGRARFSTWCYRVATNAALDELRRKRRRPLPADPTDLSRPGGTRPELVGSGPSTEDRVGTRIDVDAALATLARGVPGRRRPARPLRPRLRRDRRGPRRTTGHGPLPDLAWHARCSSNSCNRREPGTGSPHHDVRVTMADDDARDERLTGWLAVEPLDEVTRRRLVSTALAAAAEPDADAAHGATRRPHAARWIATAAAIVVVLVVGLALRDRAAAVTTSSRRRHRRALPPRTRPRAPRPRRRPPIPWRRTPAALPSTSATTAISTSPPTSIVCAPRWKRAPLPPPPPPRRTGSERRRQRARSPISTRVRVATRSPPVP